MDRVLPQSNYYFLSFFYSLVGGIVNCPVINHMYKAIKGQGAYLNDNSQKLQTSGRKYLKDAMVLLEMPTGERGIRNIILICHDFYFHVYLYLF